MDFKSENTQSLHRLGGATANRIARVAQLEARLLKAEISENSRQLAIGAAVLVAALLFALVFLGAFAAYLSLLLIESGFAASGAVGLVSFGALAVAVVVAFIGVRHLRRASLVPRRSVDALKGLVRAMRLANV